MEIDLSVNGTRVVAPDREALLSLVQKLARVGDFGSVAKDGYNEHFKYHYVSYEQFSALLKARLIQENVLFALSVDSVEQTHNEKTRSSGAVVLSTLATVYVTMSFFDTDTGAMLAVSGIGCGEDDSDKAINKAITGALKYLAMRFFLTSDQPDPFAGTQTDTDATERQTTAVTSDSAEKESAGGESVGYTIDVNELTEDQRVIVLSARKHLSMTDAEIIEALKMHPKDYQGERKTGFSATNIWAKAHDRSWK